MYAKSIPLLTREYHQTAVNSSPLGSYETQDTCDVITVPLWYHHD